MILFFLLLAASALGQSLPQKEPVKIEAQKIYQQGREKVTTLEGGAQLETPSWTMSADRVEIWGKENLYLLSGACRLKSLTKPFQLEAAYAEYDDLKKVGLALEGEGSSDPFLFKAKRLIFSEQRVRLEEGMLTTCHGRVPNYSLRAKDLELRPKRSVVGHHVALYFRKSKVFSLPWFYQDLRQRRGGGGGRQSLLPQVGRDNVNGFFARMAIPYAFSGVLPGLFLLDFAQKKGAGIGFQQNYFFSEKGHASLEVEGQRNPTQAATSLLFNAQVVNPSKRGNFQANFQRTNTIRSNLAEAQTDTGQVLYQYTLPRRTSSWSVQFSRAGTTQFVRSLRLSSLESWQFPGVKLSLKGDLYQLAQPQQPVDWEANPSLELAGRVRKWQWKLFSQRRFDLDRKRFQGDKNFPYFDTLPELTVRRQEEQMFPSLLLSLGHFREGPNPVNASRFRMEMQKLVVQPLGGSLTADFRGRWAQAFYDEGSAKFQLELSPGLTVLPLKSLTLRSEFHFTKAKGHTPFLRDRSSDFTQSRFNVSAQYRRGSYSMTATTGKNLTTKQWQLFVWENSLLSSELGTLHFRGEYDINRGKPGLFNMSYALEKNTFRAQLETSYSAERGQFLNVRQRSLFPLGHWYTLETHIQYLPPTHRFVTEDFQLVRDFCCMQASLSYRAVRREIFFSISIKAFPTKRVGIGIDDRGTSIRELPF